MKKHDDWFFEYTTREDDEQFRDSMAYFLWDMDSPIEDDQQEIDFEDY